ncbi:MAG TPA: nuclear transport factor 2 family protein [Candidatus Aquilonibacter sp.]|nr:nuclear transport factor 2 family protein [Candidatus Aquilonibacter sp.]
MKKTLAGVVALAFVAMVFVALLGHRASAGAPASDTVREADRVAIEKLMWDYTRALDSLSADAYAATYTPDGQFGTGEKAVKGHDALVKMIADLRKGAADAEAKGQKRPPMYHMEMNTYIEFVDRDHARVEGYWQTVFGGEGQTMPVRVAAAGREVNDIVRVNGQWLIQTRDVAPKD